MGMIAGSNEISYKIDGEVLLTDRGTAFLVEGFHSVLKYASGEMKPEPASIENFSVNMRSRIAIAQEYSAEYVHVIFPDKQSILMEEFPIQPVHRLGDAYLAGIDDQTRPYILYPADQLRSQTKPVCQPLDTHLTDFGTLCVLRLMLAAIGIDAPDALARVERCIDKLSIGSGDLGGKLVPALSQEYMRLAPDWSINRFASPGVRKNTGIVEILINPAAEINKTILIFGDSFLRLMLNHLSAVFTRVICLRTRFLHTEMVTLIKPDVIVTGNAERYLSYVSSDKNAHAFMLYPHLTHSDDLVMSEDFLVVWEALTAPQSARYPEFLDRFGMR